MRCRTEVIHENSHGGTVIRVRVSHENYLLMALNSEPKLFEVMVFFLSNRKECVNHQPSATSLKNKSIFLKLWYWTKYLLGMVKCLCT